MENPPSRRHRLLLLSLMTAAGLWTPSLPAIHICTINGQPTLYFTPEVKGFYGDNSDVHSYDNLDDLIKEARDDSDTPSPFSPHWRMGIANHSCFFEAQWTGRYYEHLRPKDAPEEVPELLPFGQHCQRILANEFLMGKHAADELLRLGRRWWDPSSHYTLQHWNLASSTGTRSPKRITLDFSALASVLGNQSVAVRLWGAEWIHPWDDAVRNAPRVRSLPGNFVLRKANSSDALRQIRVRSRRTEQGRTGTPHRFFALEIYGPGVGWQDPVSSDGTAPAAAPPAPKPCGHMIALFCLWETADANALVEQLKTDLLEAADEEAVSQVLESLVSNASTARSRSTARTTPGGDQQRLEQEKAALQAEIARLQAERDALQVRLDTALGTIEKTKQDSNASTARSRSTARTTPGGDQKRLEQEKAALQAEIARLQAERDALRAQLDTALGTIEKTKQELKEAQEMQRDLQALLEYQETENQQIKDQAQAEIANLKTQLEQANDQLRQAQEGHTQASKRLEDQIAELNKNLAAAWAEATAAQEEQARLEAENQRLQQDNQNLQELVDQLQSDFAAAWAEAIVAQEEQARLEAENQRLQQDKDALQVELEELQAKLQDANKDTRLQASPGQEILVQDDQGEVIKLTVTAQPLSQDEIGALLSSGTQCPIPVIALRTFQASLWQLFSSQDAAGIPQVTSPNLLQLLPPSDSAETPPTTSRPLPQVFPLPEAKDDAS